jgi:hypothetical protein
MALLRFRPPELTVRDGREIWTVTYWAGYWAAQEFDTLEAAAEFITAKLARAEGRTP